MEMLSQVFDLIIRYKGLRAAKNGRSRLQIEIYMARDTKNEVKE